MLYFIWMKVYVSIFIEVIDESGTRIGVCIWSDPLNKQDTFSIADYQMVDMVE